jgi:16S rRNA processing protein RimM
VSGAGDDAADDLIAVGRVGAAHGIRGEVVVQAFTDAPEERFAAGSVLVAEPAGAGPLVVVSSRWQGKRLVVRFEGIDDRGDAQTLRGTALFIRASDRRDLDDPDDFYDTDLIGLAAVTVEGRGLGPVRDVVHAPAADYLVIEVEGRERLVPFVAAVVPTVDVSGGTVVIDAPEGLFEL